MVGKHFRLCLNESRKLNDAEQRKSYTNCLARKYCIERAEKEIKTGFEASCFCAATSRTRGSFNERIRDFDPHEFSHYARAYIARLLMSDVAFQASFLIQPRLYFKARCL